MEHELNTDPAGTIRMRRARRKELVEQRLALLDRRDEKQAWVLANITDPQWSAELTALHLLNGRIDTIEHRLTNLDQCLPELGEPIDSVTPNIPTR
jgi:hypothetical protein